MTKKTSVKVTIVGEEFALRSDEPPAHTRAVADYVDQAIRHVLDGGGAADPRKAAILAALEITDQLLKERATHAELAEQLRLLSADVRRMLPPAKR